MKKTILSISLMVATSGMFAQGGSTSAPAGSQGSTYTNKRGEVVLPQAGDWAVGMDATPWFNYLGNFFHGNNSSGAPYASFLNQNQTIMGKYYKTDNTAYRVLLRIGINSYSQNHEVNSSDTGTAFPVAQVQDSRTISSHFVGLGAGIEKRRGHNRLQGYYGAEIMFYLAGSDTTFTYGNAYNATTNATPVWWNWSSGAPIAGLPRLTQDGPGGTFGVNLQAFLGIEYFFAPKISIGAEFTWGITFQTTGQGTMAREEINPNTGADQTDTYKTGGNSTFSLDTGLNTAWGNSSGSLYLIFHF